MYSVAPSTRSIAMDDITGMKDAADALVQKVVRVGYRSVDGKQLREDTAASWTLGPEGLAGPHARPHLTDQVATPGTGALPDNSTLWRSARTSALGSECARHSRDDLVRVVSLAD